MKLLKSKSAKLNTGVLNTAILVIVLLVVLFQIYASVVPEAQSAGDSMNASNLCAKAGGVYGSNATTSVACFTDATNVTILAKGAAIPLGGLLGGGGVVFVIIMASVVILVVKSFMKGGK